VWNAGARRICLPCSSRLGCFRGRDAQTQATLHGPRRRGGQGRLTEQPHQGQPTTTTDTESLPHKRRGLSGFVRSTLSSKSTRGLRKGFFLKSQRPPLFPYIHPVLRWSMPNLRFVTISKVRSIISQRTLFEMTLPFRDPIKQIRSSARSEKIWGLGKRRWSDENAPRAMDEVDE
jgi:hypothetical protein